MSRWSSRSSGSAPIDASDSRMPLGVFKLCPSCQQRVVQAWEPQCSACRGGVRASAVPPPPAPPPPLAPIEPPVAIATLSGAVPRPTAFHRLDEPLPAAPPRAPQKTVKVDLTSAGRPTQAPQPVPAPSAATLRPPEALPVRAVAPTSGPKKTMMVSLAPQAPQAPQAPRATPALALEWLPPAEENPEGWTLQGPDGHGGEATLHLRWNGEAWTVLDATGQPTGASTLRALGLVLRGGGA